MYAVRIANDDIERENDCVINVCSNSDTYYYDSYTQICSCYTNNILDKEVFLK